MNIGTLRPYLIVVILFIAVLYLVNQNLMNSVWLSFVGVYLLRQSKYFTRPYLAPDNYTAFGLRQPEIIYFVAFADMLLILLLCLLVRKSLGAKSRVFSIPNKFPSLLLLFLVIIGTISSFMSSMPEVSWFWLLQLTKFFTMGLLAMAIVKNKLIAKKTLEIIFIYGLFLACFVIAQKVNGGPLGFAIEEKYTEYAGRFADESLSLYRPGGIFWDANLSSSILVMLLPSWSIFSLKKGWFHQGFMMTCFTIGILALAFTASRGSWIIGFIVLLFSYQLVIKKNKIHLPIWLKKYVRIILISFTFLVTPVVLNRLSTLGQLFNNGGGLIYRLHHLQMAMHYLITRPLGLGLNVFQYAILGQWNPEYYLFDSTPAHNLFAQIGASLGIGGLLLFIKFIHKIIVQGYIWLTGKDKTLTKGLILGCFGYLLVSQFYPWWLTNPISGIMWLFLGITYVQH